jgi:hypothetical protein
MSFPVFASGDVLNASDMNAVGLWLVKTQTIGSGVTSVTVTGAFTTDYDNYLVTITGGVSSANGSMSFQMNNSTGSTYSVAGEYGNFNVNAGVTYSPAASTKWVDCILIGTSAYSANIYLASPFLSKPTFGTTDTQSQVSFYNFNLLETSSTSNTGFTIAPVTGGVTLTGGTIRVYGYRN